MTYNQIKNLIVPPAKRTAQTVHKWVQKLPNLALAGAILQIGWAILTYDLTRILVLGMFCPIGVLVSYGILLAALLVLLAAYNIYANREALAKAMVVLLAEL
ncbi:MAG: hypothetical protein JNL98_04120 [Bryobacterales bacterium]|nr:hypothetical protein [Bryobacterales bacterium]